MTRITNELFESIRQITHPTSVEEKKLDTADVDTPVKEGRVDAAHFCATHVEHDLYGEGECISEAHADPDQHGNIAWYTVQFADGIRKVQTEAMKVKKAQRHEHVEADAESIEEKQLHPNQGALDVAEPEGVLDAKDFEMLRAGKKQKAVKKEKEIAEDFDDIVGHAGKVTMNQVNKSSASPKVKKAIKKVAPDIETYGHRVAALKAAGIKDDRGPRGTINASFEQIDEIGDTPAGLKKVQDYRAAVGRQYHKTGEYDTRLSDADRKPNPFHAKDAASMPNAANKRYSRQTGAARDKKIETGTRYEEANFAVEEVTNNPFDVKNYKSQIPTKPGETAGFDSKKISTGTVYTKKFTKEKPEPAGKAFKPKAIKEGISQTIINYDDFRIDVTDNPTYGDYLRALQTMVESRDESIQQEVVAIATAAYDEKIDSIIIESKARQLFAGKLDEIRKSGSTVLDESYIIESNSTYVEYTVEKDGVRTQYVHIGTNGNK